MAPTRDQLVRLVARGASDAEAARRFDMSKSAVRRLRHRWGIATRRNSRQLPGVVPGPYAPRWGRGDLGEPEVARLYGGRRYDRA